MKTLATLALSLVLLAPVAEATTIRPMDEINPTGSITTLGIDWGRGYTFTADTADIYVTELGLATPTTSVYAVGLWDLTNSVQLALLTGIQSVANTWVFGGITPIALTQGNLYAVTLYGNSGESYYFTTDSAYQPNTADISYVDMRFCNFCNETTLPTLILTGYNYGYVDIGYQIGSPSPVPVPAAGLLLLGALGGLSLVARRRQA